MNNKIIIETLREMLSNMCMGCSGCRTKCRDYQVLEYLLKERGGVANKRIYELIDNAPTVDIWQLRQEATENALKKAEVLYGRPQGEWEHWGSPFSDEQVVNSIVCSVCGARFVEIQDEVFNFCPNCGAKMKGGKEE